MIPVSHPSWVGVGGGGGTCRAVGRFSWRGRKAARERLLDLDICLLLCGVGWAALVLTVVFIGLGGTLFILSGHFRFHA